MILNNNQKAFFELIKAGLWDSDAQLLSYGTIDLEKVFRLAVEQSVVGLVAAGIEKVVDTKVPQAQVLQFVGTTLQIEQRNNAMNSFIQELLCKMMDADIHALLIKGQGVAQSYERPLWRTCGDIDLFLNDENYEKAKAFLIPKANHVGQENNFKKHLGLTIDSWEVELHGYLRRGLSRKINKVLDEIKEDTFFGGNVRYWMNGKTRVFMLGIDNDIIYVFTHILSHFYGGGIGLRQICDWCRLLGTYKNEINRSVLAARLKKMGITNEWRSFGAFAVDYLGMSSDAVPLYSPAPKWKSKAEKICSFVIEVGNFGHNRDNSYYNKPYVIRKSISFVRRCGDIIRHTRIFPIESLRFFPYMMYNGFREALKGEHE